MNDFFLHKNYIKEKGLFEPKFYNVYFTPNEISFIENWFYWFEGLIEGHIPPLNNNQRRFVDVFNSSIKPHFDPPNKKNKYYNSLTREQKIFVKYYYIFKHEGEIKKYILNNSEDSIYQLKKPKHTLVKDNTQIKSSSPVRKINLIRSNSDIKNLGLINVTCITCGNKYPKKRYDLGFNTCINCSSETPKKIIDKGFQTREGHKQMNKGKYRND